MEANVLNYYGLREQPFGVTPDLRYLYFSPGHQEALASLYYGLETGRGFLLLVAKPGMGKTTLLMQLLGAIARFGPLGLPFQTQCTSRELLRYVLVDLGIKTPERDLVDMHEQLKEALLEAWRSGKKLVLIIDEAQGLEDAALELVRLLSNFETSHSKLMQIVLAGQPTLSSRLGHYTLDPLRQRVSIISRLQSFGLAETSKYVEHRLGVAGHVGSRSSRRMPWNYWRRKVTAFPASSTISASTRSRWATQNSSRSSTSRLWRGWRPTSTWRDSGAKFPPACPRVRNLHSRSSNGRGLKDYRSTCQNSGSGPRAWRLWAP